MKIGVIGGRLAGSYASLILSRLGHEVWLFDDSLDKEKPCGGGVTSKALRTMSWFRENPIPHCTIRTMRFSTCDGYEGRLQLHEPIYIFSRRSLDGALRDSAAKAGTRIVPERALNFRREPRGWVVGTARGAHEVDFLIGADGAASSVRAAVIGRYPARDLLLAVGYFVPGRYHQDSVLVMFQEKGFEGYLWSFPRPDHTSAGILRWLPRAKGQDLKGRVLDFIDRQYPQGGGEKQFYAARIPCLSRQSFLNQRVCGSDWALLGDAAGFTDPLTAEGIYFALRSAEILCESLTRGDPLGYEAAWRSDFGLDLQRAAGWRDRFFGGTLLFQAFTRRLIQITTRSATAQRLVDRLVARAGLYRRIREQLILSSPRILLEILCSKCSRTGVPHTRKGS